MSACLTHTTNMVNITPAKHQLVSLVIKSKVSSVQPHRASSVVVDSRLALFFSAPVERFKSAVSDSNPIQLLSNSVNISSLAVHSVRALQKCPVFIHSAGFVNGHTTLFG